MKPATATGPRVTEQQRRAGEQRAGSDEVRLGQASIVVHWLMLLWIAVVYGCIELRGYFPKGSETREDLKTWHFALGVGVLLLVAVRLGLRMGSPHNGQAARSASWSDRLALLMHFALYLWMLAMPVLGWLTLSAQGQQVHVVGWVLPPLLDSSKALADTLKGIHETAGTVGYCLIALHAAAALYHHFVVRDATLRKMLPFSHG